MGTGDKEKILNQLNGLNDKLNGTDSRMGKLEELVPAKQKLPHHDFVEIGPDIEVLSEIKFPEEPTKENLYNYVLEVIRTSKDQNCFKPDDLQIEMIMKIGNENLDVLAEGIVSGGIGDNYHVSQAFAKLATEKDKELVIKSLSSCPELIEHVIKYGWERDVRDILPWALNEQKHPQEEWLKIIAGYKDPETYEAIKRYFVYWSGSIKFYDIIKDLPGIELKKEVAEVWKNSKEREINMFSVGLIALAFGHKDALEYVLNYIKNPEQKYYLERGINTVYKHVDFDGNIDKIDEWFRQNELNIIYDKKDKKFKLKPEK